MCQADNDIPMTMMNSHVSFDSVNSHIRDGLFRADIPGCAFGVARNGEILWEQAYGWADRERMVLSDINTMFCIASVSKPITATGLMHLVDAGEICLDKPINHYLHRDAQLKVWIGDPDQVTVGRVANHTAGLPVHSNFYNGIAVGLKPSMEETIRRYGNIVTPPGERYRYSNLGYGILDHLIERVSGIGYSDFLRRHLFLPLGMNRSTVTMTPDLAGFAAVRYDEYGMALDSRSDCDHRGASLVYCSVHDLLLFGMFHLKQLSARQQNVLGDAAIDAMQVPSVMITNPNPLDLNLRHNSAYGMGWVIDNDKLDYRISHGGGMGGCASKLLLMPREGIVIAVVANQFKPLAYTIERDILAALLPGYADKLAVYDHAHSCRPVDNSSKAFKPDSALLGEWAGIVRTYNDDQPFRLRFEASGDIHARLGTNLWVLVNDAIISNGSFTGKMAGNVNTGDTTRYHYHPFHHLKLDFRVRGDVINGALINVAGSELNHWAELKKK